MSSRIALISFIAFAEIISLGCATKVAEQKLEYEFSDNGCTTGHHQFSDVGSMCVALQDDNFNNNCPQAPREAYFKQNCPGQFKPAKKSYTFMEKGICGTGRQIFDTDKALCTALQNDKLNQDCARPERESYFKLLQCKVC